MGAQGTEDQLFPMRPALRQTARSRGTPCSGHEAAGQLSPKFPFFTFPSNLPLPAVRSREVISVGEKQSFRGGRGGGTCVWGRSSYQRSFLGEDREEEVSEGRVGWRRREID